MAPKPPKAPEWHWGAQQKPQSNEPSQSLQQLTALGGDNALLRPHKVPRYHGVSRHRDTLQPRARAGTDGTAWDTLSSTNMSPGSPQGGDSSQCLAGSGTLLQVSKWCSQITIR